MKRFIPICLLINQCGFEIVDTGRRGLEIRFGEITSKPLPEGIHFYNPITSNIIEIPIQEIKLENTAVSFTKDTQSVAVNFVVTYFSDPLKIDDMYRQFGAPDMWENKLILPVILSSIKDSIGQFVADDLISKREAIRDKILIDLKESLSSRNINVTRIDLTNFDFSDAYEKAVESKVVAIQKAEESKNRTVEIQEESKQKIISSEAEAKSMQIRSEALSKNKSLVEYEAVQKWDGKLPQYNMGNSVPFINLK